MYQTYKSEEIKPPKEEKLIPKEVKGEECKSTEHKPKRSGSLFGNMDNEDILILGLLLILFLAIRRTDDSR